MGLRILVLQHDPRSPAGYVGDRLLARGGTLDLRMPHLGGPLPADAAAHDGLLILGGPMAADDDRAGPHFPRLLDLLTAFRAAGRPVLGLCLGAQLVARAFGGAVRRLGFTEFGYVPLSPTGAGRRDPLVAEMGTAPTFMQFHEDTFTLPDGAVPLLEGARCRHQGFRIGDSVYAFQCHLEATEATVRDWARLPEARAAVGDGDPVAIVEAHLATHLEQARCAAARVTDRWIALAERR